MAPAFHDQVAEVAVNASIGLGGAGLVVVAAGDSWPPRKKIVHLLAGAGWSAALGPGLVALPMIGGRFGFGLVFVAGHLGGVFTYWLLEAIPNVKAALTAWFEKRCKPPS